MQYKNIQIQTQKAQEEIRRARQRLGTVALIAGALAGTLAASPEARRVISGLAIRPAYAVVEHNSKENEPARHPVSMSSGLRTPQITGH